MPIYAAQPAGRTTGAAHLSWHPGASDGSRPLQAALPAAAGKRIARRVSQEPKMSVAALHEISPVGEPASTALAAARRVLRIEAEALDALAAALDERFERCVEQLARTRGRVVVTGMG